MCGRRAWRSRVRWTFVAGFFVGANGVVVYQHNSAATDGDVGEVSGSSQRLLPEAVTPVLDGRLGRLWLSGPLSHVIGVPASSRAIAAWYLSILAGFVCRKSSSGSGESLYASMVIVLVKRVMFSPG